MGILGVLLMSSWLLGGSYMLFQGQMRNIGLGRTLLSMLVLPMPLPLLFIFSSGFKSPEHQALSKAFHKNFGRNLLLLPFRLLTGAVGAVFSSVGRSPRKSLEYTYGRLYEEAAEDIKKEQESKEELNRLKKELEEKSNEKTETESQDVSDELIALRAERDAMKSEIDKLNDTIYAGCAKVGELYELKGYEFPDGQRYVVAPELRRESIQYSLSVLDPFVKVVTVDEMESLKKEMRESFEYYPDGGRAPFDSFKSKDGRVFVVVNDRFSLGERVSLETSFSRLGMEFTVLSESEFKNLKSSVEFESYSVEPLTVSRKPLKEFSYLYDAVRNEATTEAAFYGVARSGREFSDALERVGRTIRSSIENARERKGVTGLKNDDQLIFHRGLFLLKDEHSVSLMYSEEEHGVPHVLGEVSFVPSAGEGEEFRVNLTGLRSLFAGTDGFYSEKDREYVTSCLCEGLGIRPFECIIDKMETLQGPELSDVWCETVKCEQNREVLAEQTTIEGFLSKENEFRIEEAKERQKEQSVVVTREVSEKVSVCPKI